MKTVLICDLVNYRAAIQWCRDQELSLYESFDNDVSDFSGQWDTISSFTFLQDEDATTFMVKWG